ncbi:GPI biosynthesis protein family Pig-F-domain-containing protein, partial [Infundibulicybe gibba]
PFAQYTSVVSVHTILLGFTALFLPRTILLLDRVIPDIDAAQLTSRDKPQHPFLVPLTASPTSTLACICVGVVVLQGWWGGWIRNWWIGMALEGSAEEKRGEKALMDNRKSTALRVAWTMTLNLSFVMHSVLVIFGAPLTSHVLKTYFLALLLSILTAFTPSYCLGPPSLKSDTSSVLRRMTWVRLFAEFSIHTPIERAIVYPVIGTMVGCWIGVIPIALDWDRPWQAWPLTPAFGAIIGHISGSLFALTSSATKYLANEHVRSL